MTEWAQGNELVRREASGDLGGTMRLGAYPATLAAGSLVREVYNGAATIEERHRHRYEVNIHFREKLEAAGPALLRPVAGRRIARDHRISRPSLVHRRAVSS